MDDAECRAMAENQALEASLGKDRLVREIYEDKYAGCMAFRGWRRQSKSEDAPLEPDTSVKGGMVGGLGLIFDAPSGFRLAGSDSGVTGPSSWRRHVFTGPGGRNLVLIFQRNNNDLNQADFPVPNGYVLYERGFSGGFEWTAFTGRRTGVPVACFGIYVPAGPRERVVVTSVVPLPRTAQSPPSSNLTLTHWQRLAVDAFIADWSEWISDNIREKGAGKERAASDTPLRAASNWTPNPAHGRDFRRLKSPQSLPPLHRP